MPGRFEPYARESHRQRAETRVRLARPADVERCLEIGLILDPSIDVERRHRGLRRALEGQQAVLFVVEIDSAVVGYARLGLLDHPGSIPVGWYLIGASVIPSARRQGAGHALTAARLDWVWHNTDSEHCWYFASSENLASIALHAGFGFVEVARDIVAPNVTFSSGTGVLFVVDQP